MLFQHVVTFPAATHEPFGDLRDNADSRDVDHRSASAFSARHQLFQPATHELQGDLEDRPLAVTRYHGRGGASGFPVQHVGRIFQRNNMRAVARSR